MNLHLKNSKIILLFKIIIILGIIILKINKKSKFSNETVITGIINNIEVKEDTTIELLSKEKILVKIYKKENYKIGDKIEVEGKLEKTSNNTFFNLFNYKNYLKSKNINYIFKAQKIKLIENNKTKYKIKNKIIEHINKYKTKDYLKTFILGDNNIDEEITKTYQINGVSHLFAVSGMHLSLFALIIKKLLEKIIKKETIINITIILFFIFFAFLTNYTPSVLRALILYILLFINKKIKLNIKTIDLLIIDFVILIIHNPYYIYNAGFIYSFTISASLILASNIINNYNNYISKIFITSLISFIVSIPITINNFFEINILTPIINVIFVPLISFIIFPLSLLTIIIKPLDNIFSISISLLEHLSILIKNIKLTIILSHISWYVVIIYYISIIIFIKGIKNKNLKLFIPLILIIIIHTNIRIIKIKRITFLDVNQGDSILIENKKTVLLDTGGKKNSKYIINKTIPYLKSLGIKKLDYLITSHADYDHMGESIDLINNFKVEKVILNCGEFNELEQELIKVLDKKKIPYYSCIKELNIDNSKLYFLQTKVYDNENDNSNVIYTDLNGYKFMLMGDASITTEKEIMSIYNLPEIDVLKVGHHGSKTSSSKNFINEINPKYSVISVGKNNRYGHPNKEVLDTLEDSKIYRTDQDGSIMFKIKNKKLQIETCAP